MLGTDEEHKIIKGVILLTTSTPFTLSCNEKGLSSNKNVVGPKEKNRRHPKHQQRRCPQGLNKAPMYLTMERLGPQTQNKQTSQRLRLGSNTLEDFLCKANITTTLSILRLPDCHRP